MLTWSYPSISARQYQGRFDRNWWKKKSISGSILQDQYSAWNEGFDNVPIFGNILQYSANSLFPFAKILIKILHISYFSAYQILSCLYNMADLVTACQIPRHLIRQLSTGLSSLWSYKAVSQIPSILPPFIFYDIAVCHFPVWSMLPLCQHKCHLVNLKVKQYLFYSRILLN